LPARFHRFTAHTIKSFSISLLRQAIKSYQEGKQPKTYPDYYHDTGHKPDVYPMTDRHDYQEYLSHIRFVRVLSLVGQPVKVRNDTSWQLQEQTEESTKRDSEKFWYHRYAP